MWCAEDHGLGPFLTARIRNSFFEWFYTPKTGIPIEEGDSIFKLLRRVSRPEIQLGVVFDSELNFIKETTTFIVNCNGIYFSSQEQIAYFITQEAVYLLVHFKFLGV